MQILLDRVNALSAIAMTEFSSLFSFEFSSWIAVLIDTINEDLNKLEASINNLAAPQFTTAEITALTATAANGALFYDTTTNQLKAKVNGVIVVIV